MSRRFQADLINEIAYIFTVVLEKVLFLLRPDFIPLRVFIR